MALACFGEYAADFTDWLTSGDEAKKKRLAQRSTLLLIASLALELICLVRTNQLSGELFGLLSDKAGAAAQRSTEAGIKSDTAITKADAASTNADAAASKADAADRISGNALKQAGDAKQYAGSVKGLADRAKASAEQSLATAGTARREVGGVKDGIESARRDLVNIEEKITRIVSPRTIKDAGVFISAARTYAGTEYAWREVTPDEEDEAVNLLRDIDRTLQVAGWKRVSDTRSPHLGDVASHVTGENGSIIGDVPLHANRGTQVRIEYPGGIDALRGVTEDRWPGYVRAAAFLNAALKTAIFPVQLIPTEDKEAGSVKVGSGESRVVLVSVGHAWW